MNPRQDVMKDCNHGSVSPHTINIPIVSYPGWDIAGRLRVPRRVVAGDCAARGEVARRCRLDFRGEEEGFDCSGASTDRSRRAGAFRFRFGAEPAAAFAGEGPEPVDGRESAATLAAERVILEDMRKGSLPGCGWGRGKECRESDQDEDDNKTTACSVRGESPPDPDSKVL